jgi:hypothetical protein
VLLAASVAQRRALPWSPLTASDDFRRVDAICARHGADRHRVWHAALSDAQALMERRWPSLTIVALELYERGRLTGVEIEELIASSMARPL